MLATVARRLVTTALMSRQPHDREAGAARPARGQPLRGRRPHHGVRAPDHDRAGADGVRRHERRRSPGDHPRRRAQRLSGRRRATARSSGWCRGAICSSSTRARQDRIVDHASRDVVAIRPSDAGSRRPPPDARGGGRPPPGHRPRAPRRHRDPHRHPRGAPARPRPRPTPGRVGVPVGLADAPPERLTREIAWLVSPRDGCGPLRPHRQGRAGHRRQSRPGPRDGAGLRRGRGRRGDRQPQARRLRGGGRRGDRGHRSRGARRTACTSGAGTSCDGPGRRGVRPASAGSTCSSTTRACRPLYPTVADVSEELFDKVVDVNLKGPFRLTRARRPSHGRVGRRVDHQRRARPVRSGRPRHRSVRRGQGRAERADAVAHPSLRPDGPGEHA